MDGVLQETNQNLDELVRKQNLSQVDTYTANSYLFVIISELAGKVNQYEAENQKLLAENTRLHGVIDKTKEYFNAFGDILEYKPTDRIGQHSVLDMQKSIAKAETIPKEYRSVNKFKVAFDSLLKLYDRQVEKYFKL